LRFAPDLAQVVRQRFAKSRIMDAELFPGPDGKMRYFKPLRVEMYAKMRSWLRRYIDDDQLYLCMESQDIWHKVFGQAPACSMEVERRIQSGVRRNGAPDLIPLTALTAPSGPAVPAP
jgi:spore photoproduct lyase